MNRTLQILKYEKGKESFRMREREGPDRNAVEKALLQEEIERRILNMEQENYRFPKHFDKKDYVAAALSALGCLIMLVIGAWL